ncbi:MAG: DUF4007 family protein [Acidobacteria bacterium]|nr:DUF4007 family protein [Acidobacteriota bacterium]
MSNSPAIAPIRPALTGGVFFSRHETFHPRHSWLKKGFDAVQDRPDIFTMSDAHLELGVGKNMGQAIRYWCTAFKLIEPVKQDRSRSSEYRPTAFGLKLLSKKGWDPWLEDPASLWLLHWNLLKAPCMATAWDIVFNDIRKSEFSSDDVQAELARFRDQNGLTISESSLQKDVQCILRMYTEQLKDRPVSDENIDCPFVELKLIQMSGDSRLHQFRHGSKSSLPSEIIVAAALEFVFGISPSQKTISLSNLTYATSGPGQVFKLTESAVYSAVDDVATKFEEISISDMAGVIQMSFRKDALTLASEILDTYYGED